MGYNEQLQVENVSPLLEKVNNQASNSAYRPSPKQNVEHIASGVVPCRNCRVYKEPSFQRANRAVLRMCIDKQSITQRKKEYHENIWKGDVIHAVRERRSCLADIIHLPTSGLQAGIADEEHLQVLVGDTLAFSSIPSSSARIAFGAIIWLRLFGSIDHHSHGSRRR